LDVKRVVVAEVAEHILQLFRLRFTTGGSLYPGTDNKGFVGPTIGIPFYRALDGGVRFPEPVDQHVLQAFRAPFSAPSSYVCNFIDAELYLAQHHRDHILEHELDADQDRLERGVRVLKKATRLASMYPDDICVSAPLTTPGKPFSIYMDDFRLSNIMVCLPDPILADKLLPPFQIDEVTGNITGLIDCEGATVAPLWECASLPFWLQHDEEWDGGSEGGSAEEKAALRDIFLRRVRECDATGEWMRAMERGRPFREFTRLVNFHVGVWAELEKRVDELLEWAKNHPGVGFEEPTIPPSH
jgi:hypothetical protein